MFVKKNVTFVTISWHIDFFFQLMADSPFFLKHTQPLPEISQFSGSTLELWISSQYQVFIKAEDKQTNKKLKDNFSLCDSESV